MKTRINLFMCFFLISFMGCDHNEPEKIKNIDVDSYVELLKAGTYKSPDLPNFTSKDIPGLLAYKNEPQGIQNFPVNGISSYWMPKCSLGMYILWTIESIPAVAIDSEYLIGNFPSQNPMADRNDGHFEVKTGNEIQEIVAKAYIDWWEGNKDKEFNEFKLIDPLLGTAYRWH